MRSKNLEDFEKLKHENKILKNKIDLLNCEINKKII